MRLIPFLLLAATLFTVIGPGLGSVRGEEASIAPTSGHKLVMLGEVAPRPARDIVSSPWSIGGETLDRDFADYPLYKSYLGPLGAKGLRLQAGWAKCEKVKGVYSWEWLDGMIDDALSQGVKPWLEFSYGNKLYSGGGDTGLGGGLPSSPEALTAWDGWVRALVERYKDRVNQWEVWNEPDLNNRNTATATAYVDLYIRTASIVREVQPSGKVWALALASNAAYADAFLAGIQAKGKFDLIDAITFHGYPRNPDDTTLVDRLRSIIANYGQTIELRQGESGAPSRYQDHFALRHISFTETTQAKWDLRRLLAHRAKDIPMNLFTLSDLHYTQESNQGGADGVLRMNYKGLLATRPDKSVAYIKPAYFAVQSVFAIFDDSLRRVSKYPFTTTALRSVSLTGYERQPGGGQVAAYWFSDAPPADANGVSLIDLTLPAGHFTEPVLVDLRTSSVYSLTKDHWTQTDKGTTFRGVPVYDSPLLIAERTAVPLRPASR